MEAKQPSTKVVYTVSEVAAITGISVRALHHYDAVGLLSPAGRSEAGYRLYSAADLARLWRILLWRGLGFGLADIATLLDGGATAEAEALAAQRERLQSQKERLSAQLAALDNYARASTERMYHMTYTELQDLFGSAQPFDYAAKIAERWGHTEAYAQSEERTRHYTPEAWRHILGESSALGAQFAALLMRGVSATSAEAVAVANELHAHFERWYGPTPSDMFTDLARLNATNPELRATTDQEVNGLAEYMAAAAQAWAEARA